MVAATSEDLPTTIEEADVVIVGARLAGTATAVPLARSGLRVVVLDKVRFPSDTLSTHAMVPSGVQELLLMSALDRVLALGPAKPRYLAVNDGSVSFRERFREYQGIDFGLCIPRDQLDVLLVETARDAGVDVREHCSVEDVVWKGERAAGVRYRIGGRPGEVHEIHARVVVGADGRRSRTAAALGVWEPYRGSKNLRGFAFRYIDDPVGIKNQNAYEIFRADTNMALVLPSSPAGRTIVVHMCDARDIPRFREAPEDMWEEKLARDPRLRARIGDATNMSKMRITDDLSSFYRRSSGPGWALTGDAGHFKDPVTGNGQRDALKHGRLLGQAIARTLGDERALDVALRDYERERDRDTISTYHWGNRETHPKPSSPLVHEVLRGFVGDENPDFSDTFNRGRPVEQVINVRRLVNGLIAALRQPGADRPAILAEVASQLPHEIGIRRHRLLDGFRSTKPVSTENAGWSIGKPPVIPTHRAAATRTKDAPETAVVAAGRVDAERI
ncbi:NAD(P)/FAD-dependent oxidoreductase [Mycolicibacterium pyrenivorans]|uniref:NAD(P)/FAD-dependent oxidoreductase n=1 Tax=Mycolicibacterium pyrenivorans TaxID=187102 RepID=UPI00355921A8|nr:NAD(P)/FAD-dependent oxidoreductase [Mycolicibacterium pyrenivorans]